MQRMTERNEQLERLRGRYASSVLYNGITTTTRYVIDDMNHTGYAQVLEEWRAVNGAPPAIYRTYIYGHDLISQRQSDGTTHYYGYDGHGNVRFLTDSDGVVTDTYSYDAFGILIQDWHLDVPNPTPNTYLYCGEQWDPDLGMYYLRARYLHPANGRFWTMDAHEGSGTEPLSLHKYLYAYNDPIQNVDYSGYVSAGHHIICQCLWEDPDFLFSEEAVKVFDTLGEAFGSIVDVQNHLTTPHLSDHEWRFLN